MLLPKPTGLRQNCAIMKFTANVHARIVLVQSNITIKSLRITGTMNLACLCTPCKQEKHTILSVEECRFRNVKPLNIYSI